MKKNEVIELNGVEYTLELNRDSIAQIDQICNIDKSMEIISRGVYDYLEDIDDDYNPLEDGVNGEKIDKELQIKEETLDKMAEKSFFIWLYPNHRLKISEVKEILRPYLKDPEKAEWIGEKLGEYIRKSMEIRDEYNKQQKNLKALANKK